MYLAKKRIQKGYHFSKEGLDELKRMHDATLEQYRLSVVVFNSKDETLARKAIESKHAVRALAQELKTNHIRRLHEAKPETIETTSLHIDMVESYLRICSTVSRAAYVFVPKKD
jgi:phosphate:Na+ symporter